MGLSSPRKRPLLAALFAALLLLAPTGVGAQETEHAAPQEHAQEAGVQEGVAQEHGDEAAAEEHGDETAGQEHAEEDAHAAEGDHGEEGGHGPSWTEYGFKWINFAMLLGLLYWLLVIPPAFVVENFEFPGLRVVFVERGKAILEARRLAQEQTETAARYETESAERLARVQEEAAALLEQARVAAVAERERIEASAVDQAAQIRDGAARDLNAEVARSRRNLQLHVADLTVGMARRLVKDNLTGDDQDRLVREYLDRLGGTVA